jgi:hypothetical protein
MNVVRPRRKISQWKPGGLRSGNSVPWLMRDDTGDGQLSELYMVVLNWVCTIVIEPKKYGQK